MLFICHPMRSHYSGKSGTEYLVSSKLSVFPFSFFFGNWHIKVVIVRPLWKLSSTEMSQIVAFVTHLFKALFNTCFSYFIHPLRSSQWGRRWVSLLKFILNSCNGITSHVLLPLNASFFLWQHVSEKHLVTNISPCVHSQVVLCFLKK